MGFLRPPEYFPTHNIAVAWRTLIVVYACRYDRQVKVRYRVSSLTYRRDLRERRVVKQGALFPGDDAAIIKSTSWRPISKFALGAH
jgi:hypothetical protein